jgi:ABC-type bacteriocin/lantibiotic exporter with double-glycine peptidase domain
VRLCLPILLAVLLGAGCASPPPASRLAGISARGHVLPLEPVAQAGRRDGALACLAALLHFHGLELDDDAAMRFERAGAAGLSWYELRDYLRGRGLGADVGRGTTDGLAALVARSLPAIVALDGPGPSRRFAVVHGFDPVLRRVLVLDAGEGATSLGFEELDAAWSGHLMLVALPRAPAAPPRPSRDVSHGSRRAPS